MNPRTCFFLSITAVVLCQLAACEEPAKQTPPRNPQEKNPDLPKVVEIIVQKTNDFRKEEGREAVTVNKKLSETAQYFAEYMAKNGKLSHTADGSEPSDRAKKHGYEYCIVLENIAYEYDSNGFTTDDLGKRFVTGWKNSPGHRRNMLDPDVIETGGAVAQSAETGYYYAVQMFGRPKSMMIEFSIANKTDATINYQIAEQSFSLQPDVIGKHERCRPEEVTFKFPSKEGEKEKTESLKPKNGDHLIITKDGSAFLIRKK